MILLNTSGPVGGRCGWVFSNQSRASIMVVHNFLAGGAE